MKYLLCGVNGAGKTTLLREIQQRVPGIETVQGSSALMEFLGVPNDYNALRAIPYDEMQNRLAQFMQTIFEKKQPTMIDSHVLNLVCGKIRVVYGDWIRKFDAIIFVDISPQIAMKRLNESSRDRALFPAGTTREEKMKIYENYCDRYRQEFDAIVQKWHIPHLILDGEQSSQDMCEQFVKFHHASYGHAI